jgi:hypothetical protein
MARPDSVGLFWEDYDKVKVLKEQAPKPVPPPRTWEEPGYLPYLEEALRFDVPIMSNADLFEAIVAKDEVVFDIECYPNYFLIAFKFIKRGKVAYFELYEGCELNVKAVQWILDNFLVIGFNSLYYDIVITALAVNGKGNETLHKATESIIALQERGYNVLRHYKVKPLEINHIDLISVAPLQGSLKIYGGRLHCRKMQELPFKPGSILSPEQMAIVRYYCVNDLDNTELVLNELREQLTLRAALSAKYGTDVRSKSDAQVAEEIMKREVARLNFIEPKRPEIAVGTVYRYNVPLFLQYRSRTMQAVLEKVRNAAFVVTETGNVTLPAELDGLQIRIAGATYTMGIGGLHSNEKCTAHHADETTLLCDRDVTSYYPAIILNLGLYPKHLGPNFLKVYRSLVDRRIEAKKAKNKTEADSLKIVVNGTFGKLLNKWSIMYAPDLGMQVTMTGQLSLLMLIERLELAGIPIVSANTDGIVIKCPKHREADTGFATEETRYKAIYSKDVNNYIAVKLDNKTKTKGLYNNPWNNKDEAIFRFHKNPTNSICIESVTAYLTTGTPLHASIRACKEVQKFITVRSVTGGAVKDGIYLGKAIRWIYTDGDTSDVIYAKNGHKVPKSTGATPVMEMPSKLPSNINYSYYEAEATKILKHIAALAADGMVEEEENETEE